MHASRQVDARDIALAVSLLAGSLLAMFAVASDLLGPGPLDWHLAQPATVEGGAEALFLLALLSACAACGRSWCAGVAVFAGIVYLRRHNAELSLLAGAFFVEALLAWGILVRRSTSGTREPPADAWPAFLLLGMAAWLVTSLLLSLIGLATPPVLAGTLLIAGTAALAWNRVPPISVQVARAMLARPPAERAVFALLVGWFLVLAARSGNVVAHDALWYLGQGDRLLAPNGSVFEALALVSPVHYFPKLWETFLLPLTVFDQLRVQASLAIAMLAVFMALAWRLAARMQMPVPWRLWLVWMLATLPAIANTALSLKTDLACAVMLAVMCIGLADWMRDGRKDHLLFALGAAALACSSKLTAIPYVAAALVFAIGLGLRSAGPARAIERAGSTITPAGVLAAVLCGVVALGFLLRTWWLAGVPTIGPDPLMAIWHQLGLHLREPAGTLDWTKPQRWSDVPALIHDWLLAPSSMPKIRIGWTGNAWALFAAVAFFGWVLGIRPRHPRSRRWHVRIALLMALTGLVLAVAWRYHSRGSDGNYFLFPVTMAMCLAVGAVAARVQGMYWSPRTLALAAFLFGSFHATQSFITTAWSPPGTRTLDLDLGRSPFQPGVWRREELQRAGLSKVEESLRGRPRAERAVSSLATQVPVLLPVRMEALHSIGYSRPEYTEDATALFDFMRRFEIRHLLLEPESIGKDAHLHAAAKAAGWSALTDEGGVLYSDPVVR